jgi:hypothetical protein
MIQSDAKRRYVDVQQIQQVVLSLSRVCSASLLLRAGLAVKHCCKCTSCLQCNEKSYCRVMQRPGPEELAVDRLRCPQVIASVVRSRTLRERPCFALATCKRYPDLWNWP